MAKYQNIIDLLIKARLQKKLTQTQLAEKLGKPQSYIAKYETLSRKLDLIEFMQICEALQLRPSKVMVLVQ